MDVSAAVGLVSIVLAVVAIWHSVRSERRSDENYRSATAALAEVSKKAEVIQTIVDNTHGKLLDTVTDIASPKDKFSNEIATQMLPRLIENPELLERFMNLAQNQKNKP